MKAGKWSSLVMVLLVAQSASAVSIWGKVKNTFNDCSYSDSERRVVLNYEKQTTPKLPDHYFGTFSQKDVYDNPWMKDFRYIIVVDRAAKGPTAQTMTVYQYGSLLYTTKVSTGRETFELRRKNKICSGAPMSSYWSNTPTGFYTPKFLSKDHRSGSWDASMPEAIFYDVDNGLALHAAGRSYIKYLGNRASGGCTRQHPEAAEQLFERVKATSGATVPEVNVNGTPVLDENGQVKYSNRQVWTSKTGKVTQFTTFSALIIVQDSSGEYQ